MNYKTEMTLDFSENMDILNKRIKLWSEKYKFKLTKENEIWYCQRGSHFRASCSFDVRYVPTTVTIKLNDNKIDILFHVKSFFYHAMPSDNSRVDEQLELLMAYLKGVFDG